jgi:Flp pilus assembly protein CpaB
MDRIARVARRLRRTVLARRRLLAALSAAAAVAVGLQAVQAPAPATTAVLTASHDLDGGSVVRAGDLDWTPYDAGQVPDGAVSSAAQVVGRTTTTPVRAGEPLTDVRVLAGSLLAGYPGAVAVPVRIGDPGAVALLRVGDRIDILAADPHGHSALVVADDVPVVAIPVRQSSDPATVPGGLVVVATSPENARDLAAAGVSSYLSLVIAR